VNGTLKSIQYPTGGKSQFEYELNNFYGSITNYTPSASFGSTLILTGYEGADRDLFSIYHVLFSI